MIYMFGVVITVYCKFLKHLDLCVFFLNSLQEYGIRGFPTIKVFAPGKPPVDYQGARDVKPIAEFALQQVCWNLLWGVLTFLPKKFMVKYFWHVWVVLHVGVWIEYIRVLFLWQKKQFLVLLWKIEWLQIIWESDQELEREIMVIHQLIYVICCSQPSLSLSYTMQLLFLFPVNSIQLHQNCACL